MAPSGEWRRTEGAVASNVLMFWEGQNIVYRPDVSKDDPYDEFQHFQGRVNAVVDVPFSHGTLAVSSKMADAFSESGTAFVAAGLEYGRQRFGLEQYIVEVAQFNLRAINVYRRLRFRPIEEFRQRTNGGVHDFVRMVAPAIRLGACVLMVDNRERIALQLRDAKPNVNDADCWGVFGGGMRPGEAPGETIVREVQEELGVTLPPTGLRWVKQVVSPLLIRSHVHTYRLHDELENARLREGQKFALVGRDEIQVGGVLQGKRVAPFHLELLEDYWAGKLTDA